MPAGKEGPDIKGATAKEWSVNAMVLVPIFAFYCYWKHDKLMQSDWWLWYQVRVLPSL